TSTPRACRRGSRAVRPPHRPAAGSGEGTVGGTGGGMVSFILSDAPDGRPGAPRVGPAATSGYSLRRHARNSTQTTPHPAGEEVLPMPVIQRDRLAALIGPAVEAAGYDLESVTVSQAGRRSLVRVVVDADRGVTLDGVADVSRLVSTVLDGDEGVTGRSP